MSDVKELLNKIEDEQVRTQLSEQFDALSGSTLRKTVDDLQAENKTLKQEKRHRVYADANLPEGAYDVFDSMYEGELDVEALQSFAKEKGFALPDASAENGNGENADNQEQAAQQRQAGEDRLGQLGQGQIPARDPSIDDEMAKAEAEGDWSTFDRLAAQKLATARQAS